VVDLWHYTTTVVAMTVTLSIKIPVELRRRLEQEARERCTTTSNLMRQALQLILETESRRGSCFDLSEDLFRDLGAGPRDLSANDAYLDDFGR
jgi:predicted DNA-binding protein